MIDRKPPTEAEMIGADDAEKSNHCPWCNGAPTVFRESPNRCERCGLPVFHWRRWRELAAEIETRVDPGVLDAAVQREDANQAEIARLSTWQPMKTAPRDGTEVLLQVAYRAGIQGKCLVGHYIPGGHCIGDHPPIDEGWYFWNGCMFDRAAKPIVWMPIPEVTAADAAKEE